MTVEAWTTVRYLYARGVPKKQIARTLKISRNTVRAALLRDKPPRYERPPKPNPQIEPFRDEIAVMLFGPEPLIGSRILEDLQGKGYRGGKTALYRYLQRLRADEVLARKVRIRFETGPAEQGQFDWSPYRVSIGGVVVDVLVYRLILGFSRFQALWVSRDHTWMSVYEALEEGLHAYGGVPRGVVVDNDRCFTDKAFPGGTWSGRWLEFCGHYAFEPIPCKAYHPESKGKVENPFRYLEEHLIKGRAWSDWEAFCHDLRAFQDHVNQRVHGTTRERPAARFEQERPLLAPLPARRFVATDELWRSVSWDCLFPWAGCRYDVPPALAGQRVRVRTSQGTWLHVFTAAGERVAVHRLSEVKGATVLNPAHRLPAQRAPRTRVLLERRFRERFPGQDDFLQRLYEAHPARPSDALRAVLSLAAIYPPDAMVSAFASALLYHTFTPRFLAGLLANVPPENRLPAPEAPYRSELPRTAVSRDLAAYQRVLQRAGEGR